jgi:hypothetical protein
MKKFYMQTSIDLASNNYNNYMELVSFMGAAMRCCYKGCRYCVMVHLVFWGLLNIFLTFIEVKAEQPYQFTGSQQPHQLQTIIGVGVQGKAKDLEYWRESFIHFNNHSHVRLFLLSYDQPMSGPVVENVHNFTSSQKTTWTSGRNFLGQQMFKYEEQVGHAFRYWVFADDDSINEIDCMVTNPEDMKHIPVFCLGEFFSLLMDHRYAWAQLAISVNTPPALFQRLDCPDAYVIAMHRAAIPVMFPYVERLDNLSWWESQAFLFQTAPGCVPYGGVGTSYYFIRRRGRHGQYPRGFYPELRRKALHEIYGSRGLCPHPINCDCSTDPKQQGIQGNCFLKSHLAELEGRVPKQFFLPANNSFMPMPFEYHVYYALRRESYDLESSAWYHSEEFHFCLASLNERFLSYVKMNMKLVDIDGPLFTVADTNGIVHT